MTLHIEANRTVCIGSGQCVFSDPDAFDQDDDGLVVLLREDATTPDEIARAKEAVQVCPARALAVTVAPAG